MLPVTNEMPSAANSRNKLPPVSPASEGGGVLPAGNNEALGGNTLNSTTGTAFFDEGGLVDESDGVEGQGAASATVDPLQMVRAGLAHGRKQAGLPDTFYGAATPSFDDGGVVPDPQAQAQGPDPRKAMAYLAGDGAIAPDIVSSLEQSADPDGTMSPSERTMAVFGKVQSPDAAAGLLAHYRTRWNGYSAAMRAALDQGDYPHAALYANQAFAALPTGHNIQFAPGPNGLIMATTPHGQNKNAPAMAMGGTVDASNPQEEGDNTEAFDEGGEIDPYENMPESDNIEDRRNDTVEGTVQKNDGPTPESAGAATVERYARSRQEEDRRAKSRQEGVIPKQAAFDDGGEVPWGEAGAYDAGMGGGGGSGWGAPDDTTGGDTQNSSPAGTPTRELTAQQAAALVNAGYDKLTEEAIQNMGSLRSFGTPSSPPASNWWDKTKKIFTPDRQTDPGAPLPYSQGAPAPEPQAPQPQGAAAPGVLPSAPAPAEAPAQAPEAPPWYDEDYAKGEARWKPKAAEPEADPNDTRPIASKEVAARDPKNYREGTPREQARMKAEADARDNDPEMQKVKKYERVAWQMFPWASQKAQRDAYIEKRRQEDDTQAGRESIARVTQEGKTALQESKNSAADIRSQRSSMTRENIAKLQAEVRMLSDSGQREMRVLTNLVNNNPAYADTPEYKQRVEALTRNERKSPGEIHSMVASMMNAPAAGGQQQQQRGPIPAGVQPTGQSRIDPSTGRGWLRYSDGKWRPAGSQ